MTIKDILEEGEKEFEKRILALGEPKTDEDAMNYYRMVLNWHKSYQSKLINHFIEMIDKERREPEAFSPDDKVGYEDMLVGHEVALDTLKQKLLQEQGESKI
jgi:hypothetical protein